MFEGIFCPTITILDDEGKIDYELWGKHLDHLAEAGLNGVLLFGSIGEFYSVTLEDKKAATEFAVKRVGDRMKVFIGVGDTNFDNVLELTRFAETAGADAVLAVSPYYFGPTDAAAMTYFGGIAEATKLPVILYNFPARTGTDLSRARGKARRRPQEHLRHQGHGRHHQPHAQGHPRRPRREPRVHRLLRL